MRLQSRYIFSVLLGSPGRPPHRRSRDYLHTFTDELMTDMEKTKIISAQHLSSVGRASLQRHEGIKDYYDDIAGN